MAKMPAKMVKHLKSAHAMATFDTASFGMPNQYVISCGADGVPYGEPMQLDAFIREKTRVYRSSWVLHPLNILIAWAEGKQI